MVYIEGEDRYQQMLFPDSIEASIGTDSNGGHHDYNNASGLGDYHYHHGYSAHLHKDGVCPYGFDDKTGMSSGGSSSKTGTTGSSEVDASTTRAKETHKTAPIDYIMLIVVVVLSFCTGFFIDRDISPRTEKIFSWLLAITSVCIIVVAIFAQSGGLIVSAFFIYIVCGGFGSFMSRKIKPIRKGRN